MVDASATTDIDYSAARPVLDRDRRSQAAPAIGERWIFTSLHEALAALNLPER